MIIFNEEISKTRQYHGDWRGEREKELQRYINNDHSVVHIAKIENKLIGYSITYANEITSYCVFEELYIDSKYRQKGLGKAFFQVRKDWCKKYGYPIKLEVYKWNDKAIEFHVKNGFVFDSLVYVLENY